MGGGGAPEVPNETRLIHHQAGNAFRLLTLFGAILVGVVDTTGTAVVVVAVDSCADRSMTMELRRRPSAILGLSVHSHSEKYVREEHLSEWRKPRLTDGGVETAGPTSTQALYPSDFACPFSGCTHSHNYNWFLAHAEDCFQPLGTHRLVFRCTTYSLTNNSDLKNTGGRRRLHLGCR